MGPNGPGKTLAEHWDGGSWSMEPTVTTQVDTLTGIAAVSATDVWAVGVSITP